MFVLILGYGRNIDRSGGSVCSNDGGFGVDLFHSLNLMDPPVCSSSTMVLFPSVCVLNHFGLSLCCWIDVRCVESRMIVRFWTSCFVLFLLVG